MTLNLSKDFVQQELKVAIENEKVGAVIMQDVGLTPKLQEFYYNNYYPGYILSNNNFFDWMFKNNGGKVAVLTHNEQVIAHQGHVPIVLTDGRSDYKGFISASTMVDRNYRRKGLMSTLRSSLQQRYEMASSIGGSKLGIALYSSMGYQHLGYMYRMIALHNPALCSEVSRNSSKLEKTFDLITAPNHDVGPITNFLQYTKQVDDLRNTVLPVGEYFGVKRDSQFFQWRYVQHPIFDYKIFGLWSGDSLKALIVFRLEKVVDTGATVIRVTELLGEKHGLQELIKATVFNQKFSQGVAWVDWFTTNKKICEIIKDLGFKYQEDIAADFPIFCSPIDYSKDCYPVMFWSKNESKYNELPKLENWYLTKGDGDADRPNTAEGYSRENN